MTAELGTEYKKMTNDNFGEQEKLEKNEWEKKKRGSTQLSTHPYICKFVNTFILCYVEHNVHSIIIHPLPFIAHIICLFGAADSALQLRPVAIFEKGRRSKSSERKKGEGED